LNRAALLLTVLALSVPSGARAAAPTYLVEWNARTGESRQRLTLFCDGVLVRKTTADGKTEMKKRKLAPAEYDSYAAFFRSPEALAAEGIFDSGMTGEAVARSVITVTRENGEIWKLAFDSFSAVTPEAQRVRAALEDLRDSFGRAHAATADFTPEKLAPGKILRRLDGTSFRVVHYDERSGIVELRGLDEPYSQFYKLENLRLSFLPP